MDAWSYLTFAGVVACTVRLFWHLRLLTPRVWDGQHPRATRRWSGRLLRGVGWWQIAVGACIAAMPGPDLAASWLGPVGMGLLTLLAGQAKSPTALLVWLARRWRPAAILVLLGRAGA